MAEEMLAQGILVHQSDGSFNVNPPQVQEQQVDTSQQKFEI